MRFAITTFTIAIYVHSTWEDCFTLVSFKFIRSMGMKISMMNSKVLKQSKFSLNVSNSVKEGMLKQEKIRATTARKSLCQQGLQMLVVKGSFFLLFLC